MMTLSEKPLRKGYSTYDLMLTLSKQARSQHSQAHRQYELNFQQNLTLRSAWIIQQVLQQQLNAEIRAGLTLFNDQLGLAWFDMNELLERYPIAQAVIIGQLKEYLAIQLPPMGHDQLLALSDNLIQANAHELADCIYAAHYGLQRA